MELNIYQVVDSKRDVLFYISQLCNKLYQSRSPSIILARDKDSCNEINKKLWSINIEEFIPHNIYTQQNSYELQDIILIYDNINSIVAPKKHYNLILAHDSTEDIYSYIIENLSLIIDFYQKTYLFTTPSTSTTNKDKLLVADKLKIIEYTQNSQTLAWNKL